MSSRPNPTTATAIASGLRLEQGAHLERELMYQHQGDEGKVKDDDLRKPSSQSSAAVDGFSSSTTTTKNTTTTSAKSSALARASDAQNTKSQKSADGPRNGTPTQIRKTKGRPTSQQLPIPRLASRRRARGCPTRTRVCQPRRTTYVLHLFLFLS